MKSYRNLKLRTSAGQSVIEMVVVLPLLLLMAAGMAQIGLLMLIKSQFEHACGEAARRYNAGLIHENSIAREIWNSLGSYQRYFIRGSVQIRARGTEDPKHAPSPFSESMESILSLITKSVHLPAKTLLNYSGGVWTGFISARPPPFFFLLFENGILLRTQFAVWRHPAGGWP